MSFQLLGALFGSVGVLACSRPMGHGHHHRVWKANAAPSICLSREEVLGAQVATEIVEQQPYSVPVVLAGKVTFSERFATLRFASGARSFSRRPSNSNMNLVASSGAADTRVLSVTSTSELDPVTVIAEIREADLGVVRSGTHSRIEAADLPGLTFSGEVDDIGNVDPSSRTARVRLTVENPEHRLRPDMAVSVAFPGPYRATLLVPKESVARVGNEAVVYERAGATTESSCFRPRVVVVDPNSTSPLVPVLSGLRGGESIVSNAHALGKR